MADMRDHVEAMSARVAARITPGLQSAARKAGWPADLSLGLSVGHTSGVLSPKFTGSEKQFQKVQDLEFGTYEAPPTAAVFNFFESHATKTRIQDDSLRSMDEVLRRIEALFS